jgi:hypothetical protein
MSIVALVSLLWRRRATGALPTPGPYEADPNPSAQNPGLTSLCHELGLARLSLTRNYDDRFPLAVPLFAQGFRGS